MTTPSAPDPAPPTASSLDQIAQEHRHLLAALDRLAESEDPRQILPRLEELRGLLEEHFAGEEASDGLPRTVGTNAPHLLVSLERIFDEHREILRDLQVLADESRAVIGRVGGLKSSVAEFVDRMHDHEARETELINDAVYTDIGPGD